jgi:hypothetical protein
MTMPSSGVLNMGGTSSPVSVAYELGLGLTTTISMNQAAVRTLAGVGGSGTTWSMSSLYGKSSLVINNAISCASLSSTSGTSTTATINFNSNGSITYYDPVLSSGSTNWATPTTTGVGSSYWIKITRTSGSVTGGLPSGSVVSLSAGAQISLFGNIDDVLSSAGNIDIYSNSGGTTRVGGGTYTIDVNPF